MHYSKPEGAIDLMRQVKAMLDPNGILNPCVKAPQPADHGPPAAAAAASRCNHIVGRGVIVVLLIRCCWLSSACRVGCRYKVIPPSEQ